MDETLHLVMSFELGTKSAQIYKGGVCDWYVLTWDGAKVKAIECCSCQQALDVFDRCLGEPKAEA